MWNDPKNIYNKVRKDAKIKRTMEWQHQYYYIIEKSRYQCKISE